ncbi:MAG: response regulator [Nitrospirae bacterium]|nr:response regulator [Nitrospirota bacterium]MBI3593860.1 response regulator [Nitrospirota bacterium]
MQIVVLLVEDDPDHAEMTKSSLEEGDDGILVHWVKDGQEVIDYLHKKGVYEKAIRPDMILLDINLPKLSGIDVLKKIKEDVDLKVIPVIMLTTSDRGEEILKCYAMGVNSFITKPVQFKDFSEKIKSLKLYWLTTNSGPKHDNA